MAEENTLRRWFDEHGWQLEPAELTAALNERGADEDTVIVLIDEGADRRRANPPPAQPHRQRVEQRRNGAAPTHDAPPQNLEAEESVLGAILLSPSSLQACRDILQPDGGEFYLAKNALVWRAALKLADRGVVVDAITVRDLLEQTGELDSAGGRVRLHELAALVVATANATHYARIVAHKAQLREQEKLGVRLTEAARGGSFPADLRDAVIRLAEQPTDQGPPPEAVDAGTFVFEQSTSLDSIRIWGDDTMIGWAAGEGLMLIGPDGVGKTTLGQQLALARAGLRPAVLGMPVTPEPGRVLYIAADRPRQAARSLRRMVAPSERDRLGEQMTVWRGPLPMMLNEDRTILTRMAKQFGAQTVIIDSLKDVAVDVATDEAGGRIASAFQHAIASEIELLVLHHPRKPGVDQHRKPKELSDSYGSRLIYGVMGSVVLLWGNPGDPIVELSHLKQPVDEIGPWNIRHDHPNGTSTVERQTDLIQVVLNAGSRGITATTAAGVLRETETPSRNEIEKARAKLDRLVTSGRLVKHPGDRANDPPIYLFNGPAQTLQ